MGSKQGSLPVRGFEILSHPLNTRATWRQAETLKYLGRFPHLEIQIFLHFYCFADSPQKHKLLENLHTLWKLT